MPCTVSVQGIFCFSEEKPQKSAAAEPEPKLGERRPDMLFDGLDADVEPPFFWSAANLWHGSSRRQTAEAAAAGRSPPPPAVPTRQERHPARCLPTPCGHGPSEKPVHTRVHSDRGIVAENTPNGFPQFSQNMSEYSESFKYSDNSGNCKIWTAANYLRLRVDSTPQGILSPLRGAQAQKRQDRSCGSCL